MTKRRGMFEPRYLSFKSVLCGFAAASIVAGCCGCPPIAGGAKSPTSASGGVPAGSTEVTSEEYQWKNVQMLGGGFVTGVIFSPAEKDLIYARTDIGGAYRWEQSTQTWIPLTDHISRPDSNYWGIESLAPDPTDPNRVYMAVGTYTQSWAGNGAMMRSSDKGETWELLEMPIKMGGNENGRGNGERLAVDPNKPSTILFGSRKYGLWRSDNSGQTWEEGSFPVKEEPLGVGINFVLFDKASGKQGELTPVIYAGFASKETGLYRSKNAGKDWEPVPNQPKGMMPNHAGFDKDGIMYFSYADNPGPSDVRDGAVWKLDPKSGAWTNITPLKPSKDETFGYGGVSVLGSASGTLMVVRPFSRSARKSRSNWTR